VCHLGAGDLEQARRRTEDRTRLGYALQLVTVRAIGTFLSDPTMVPAPVLATVAGRLGIADLGVLDGYADMPVRWRHTAEIRDRHGYRDFTAQPGHFLFTVWLYRGVGKERTTSRASVSTLLNIAGRARFMRDDHGTDGRVASATAGAAASVAGGVAPGTSRTRT
jgi:hypothetical protein